MIYGYARVSTKGQAKDGFSLEVQEVEILAKYDRAKIFREQYTGTKTDRPVFNKILSKLKAGDILVVTKLDRLARNTIEGVKIIQELFEKGVSVHVLNVGHLENTTMGKFFVTTLLAVAEMERSMIVERTQAGKEVAKTKAGYREGRPKKFTKEQIKHALSLLESYSYTQVERMTTISKATLVREMRKQKALLNEI